MLVRLNHTKVKRVLASVDWGFTNPGVMQVWAVDNDSRVYLVHEEYQTKKLIAWWVEKAIELRGHFQIEAFICDPAEPAFIEQFRRAGLNALSADNEIAPGIQSVQERLQVQSDGLPRLFIFSGALAEADRSLYREYPGDTQPVCTEQEFGSYVWPDGKDGKPNKEVPVDAYNHGMDCMRYLVKHLETPVQPSATHTRGDSIYRSRNETKKRDRPHS